MPKVTVRPTKQDPNYKRLSVMGASGAGAAVSDQSDSSYVRRRINGAPMARFMLAKPTIPSGNDIATIVPGARLKQPTSRAPRLVNLAMSVWGKGKPKNSARPVLNGPQVRAGAGTTIYDFMTPPGSGVEASPKGAWSSVLSELALRVNDGHDAGDSNRAYIYELWADVYYCARPQAAITITPESPVTTTSYPELTTTLSALVEAWQDGSGPPARTDVAYELKVYTSAQVDAPGFDPAKTTPVWGTRGVTAPLDYIDGSTPSSEAAADVPDVPLVNGSYRAYARGRRMFAAAGFGSWATLDFEVDVTPPAPTLTATKNDATQSVAVSVTPVASTDASDPLVTVERSRDGGLTWTPVRDALRIPATFGVALEIEDREAPRGVSLKYRANVEATISDQQLVSAWTVVTVSGMISASGWNLKAPLDPSLDMLNVAVEADPEYQQEEDVATFRPIGRSRPVVVSSAIGGADGNLSITTTTEDEWVKLMKLRDYAGTLYLQSPFGWDRYVRVVSRSWSEYGAASAARRRLVVSYLEVEAP